MPSKRAAKPKASKAPKKAKITGYFAPADGTASDLASSRQTISASRTIPSSDGKPDPIGSPVVWSDRRQGLCETLPWFKANQGGVQRNGGYVYGQLVSTGNGLNDHLDEEIIITRCGGCREKDDKKGKGGMSQASDQSKHSEIVECFFNSAERKNPIGIISGRGNPNNISKLPHHYCVFDFFFITDVWCVKENGFKLWLVRLQKIDLKTKSWWSPQGTYPLPMSTNLEQIPIPSQVCPKCNLASNEIYQQGWTCLQWDCTQHFKFYAVVGDGKELSVDDGDLNYTQAFLNKRSDWVMTEDDFQMPDLCPPLIQDEDRTRMGEFGYEAKCKGGIVCQKCKSCIRRIYWDRWECESPSCDFVHRVTQYPVPVDVAKVSKKGKAYRCVEEITARQITSEGYDVTVYQLPGESAGTAAGFVLHFKASKLLNKAKGGADDLFIDLQKVDLGMKRRACQQAGHPGEILTAHWSTNFGVMYKFHVKQDSKAFFDAPEVILEAMKKLFPAGKTASGVDPSGSQNFQGFNECLSVGYFGNAHMGWHDDGEKELGPTVASLSLGCDATMEWRPKAKTSIGKCTSKAGNKLAMLSIKLEHGDIMVMHGAPIQKLYEHHVDPLGPIRFALTCRYIRPETLSVADRALAMAAGSIPIKVEADANVDGPGEITEVEKDEH